MDPVSIFGLAASIVTFIDVGFKLVHQYNDMRRNRLVETRSNTLHRDFAQQLRNISDDLAADGPPALTKIGKGCSILCTELIELLDKHTMKNPTSWIERSKVIVKSWRSPPDISSLETRLGKYSELLTMCLQKNLRYENINYAAHDPQLTGSKAQRRMN